MDPDEIDFIYICHGGDHGKEKFRFAAKVLIRMNDGRYYDDVFGLADVACKKDHPEVLDNTCMPDLITGINAIENGVLVFETDGQSLSIDLVSKDLVSESANKLVIRPISFLSGDLAFLAYMMGKENFSPAWCNWCSLSKQEWQEETCIPVDEAKLWSVESIGAQVCKNTSINFGPGTMKTDVRMKGVRRAPRLTGSLRSLEKIVLITLG